MLLGRSKNSFHSSLGIRFQSNCAMYPIPAQRVEFSPNCFEGAVDLHSNIIENPKSSSSLLVFHGLFGSSSNWRSAARKLAARVSSLDIHLLDLRNHGQSPHRELMNHDSMVKDILLYIRKHNLHGVSLLGHSMGGRLAMNIALRHPSVVSRLVVVDVAPVDYPPFDKFNSYIEIMKALDLTKLNSRKDADDYLKSLVPQFGVRQFLLTNLTTTPSNRFAWRVNLDFIQRALPELRKFGIYDHSAKFGGPTLFIGGKLSDYIKEEYHPIIQHYFPQNQLKMIEGSGHWVHAEKPEEVVDLISDFLSSPLKEESYSSKSINDTILLPSNQPFPQ